MKVKSQVMSNIVRMLENEGPFKDVIYVILENVSKYLKMIATMCSCGAITVPELQKNAKITLVSSTSIVEGGAHDVILKAMVQR